MRIRILVILTLIALMGCQSGVMVRSEDSSAHRATGVTLLRPLTLSPETTRVFVQDGKALQRGMQGDLYRAQCAFEVHALSSSERIIDPARFTVTRVQSVVDEVVQSRPLQLAALNLAGIDGGGSPQVHAGYHFWFEPGQADVRRMSCYGVFAVIEQVEPPTLEDIRRTLSGLAELIVVP